MKKHNEQLFNAKRLSAISTRKIFALALLLLTVMAQGVSAQQLPAKEQPGAGSGAPPSSPTIASAAATASVSRADERYRIGPNDVLDVRVFNRPQLSRDAIRVDGRGMIRMPLIEDEIQAACRTEGELGREIATRYLKYQRNPQVDVFIKEYQSQPVAVIGAVNQPGRFQLQRRVRLLELLTFAGGPADRAGRNIQIVHTAPPSICEAPATTATASEPITNLTNDALAQSLVAFKLTDTLSADDKSNPYVRPGDIVSVLDADQIYVTGNVLKPSIIALKEPITVTRAIATAGGTLPDTKSDRVRIIRQLPGSTSKTEIYVDLKAIDKRRAEDVALLPNDIVDVPASGAKKFLRTLIGGGAAGLSQLPVRVIP